MMSKYPVGAMWRGVEKNPPHRIARIWLNRRSDDTGYEMWMWDCSYDDGSRPVHWSDWNPSYRMCKNELPIECRMKRVK